MSAFPSRAARWTVAIATATLLGACQDQGAIVAPDTLAARDAATANGPTATVAWNRVAQQQVIGNNTNAPATIRLFALLTVAQYDAVVTAERAKEREIHPSARGAVAGASAVVLSYIYPNDSAHFEALVEQQSSIPGTRRFARADFEAGEAIGRRVAAEIVERAKTDGFFAPYTGTVPVCPGCWVPVPTPPAFATLGQAKPFLLESNAQFRPAPPPAFGSPEFAAALAEVRRVADTRTAEQDSIAKYWALGPGTVSAQGYWNEIGSNLAEKYRLGEREAARRLAMMNIAAFDGIISSHEAKYHYWLIRPSQADPGIALAIGLPSFPAYPSNHSTLAGASSAVLGKLFPAERAWLEPHAEEGAISRLYGGIHYRFDTEAGLELGRRIAAWTLAHGVVGHEPIVLD